MFWPNRGSDLVILLVYVLCNQFGTLAQRCVPSPTTARGQRTCSGEVIFEENFDSTLDRNRWRHTIRISGAEEQEFVIYDKRPENSYTRGGILYVKPQLLPDSTVDSGSITLDGCVGAESSGECHWQSQSFNIMPPVMSAELKSLPFTFRYGKVSVRARMPFGDWIVPHIYLRSQFENYGKRNSSARVTVVKSHGNNDLYLGTKDIGRKRCSQFVKANYDKREGTASLDWLSTEGWDEDFHVYEVEWTPDHLIFGVDDQPKHHLRMTTSLQKMFGFEEKEQNLEAPAAIPPFEQEFYLGIALYVGGMKEFPDEVENNRRPKPWNNRRVVKARLNFWRDRDAWYPTWDDETSALQVDYIRITAL
uniref:GRP4 n=1 Tax=Nilaparvata lugens TaxID=108931 RepID=M9ZV85_NILLU|nr:GRP4 [Nilaparvata lugens]